MDARSSPIEPHALLAEAGFLHALARELAGDVHAADDLVQDTLLTALERPPRRDEGAGGLRGWLATVLRNRARQRHRGETRRRAREEQSARPEAIEFQAGDVEARMLLLRRLADAIAALPEPQRTAVTLRWLDGLSPSEVARAQGVAPEAARQRLSRAVATLRELLDREYRGRAEWSVIALVLPSSIPAATSLSTASLKGISMSLTTKIVAVSVLAAVLAVFAFRSSRHAEPESLSAQADAAASIDAKPTNHAAPVTSPTAPNESKPVEPTRVAATPTPTPRATNALDRELRGIVLDPAGRPVSGATISVTRRESDGVAEPVLLPSLRPEPPLAVGSTKSAEDGTFVIAPEPARSHALDVSARGLATAHVGNRYAGEHVVVHLVLGASVEGTVTRKQDHSPVAHALVQVVRQSSGLHLNDEGETLVVETDDAGRYRADGFTAGLYWVAVHPREDPDSTLEFVTLTEANVARFDVALDAGRTITGRVTDAATKQAVVGAVVGDGTWSQRRTETDANGVYTLHGVSTQAGCSLTVVADGFGAESVAVPAFDAATKVQSGGNDVTAAIDRREQTLEIVLHPGHVLRARIVGRDGQPIAGAHGVVIARGDYQQRNVTDSRTGNSGTDGKVEITGLRADLPHVFVVRREGFGTLVYDLPANEPQTETLELGDVVLDPMAIVSGTVVDGAGKPRADQYVSLLGSNTDRKTRYGMAPTANHARDVPIDAVGASRAARTDDQGRFVFADVAPGDFVVRATLEGVDDPVEASVHVAAGARISDTKLVLDEGLSIEGHVFGADGNPIEKADISTNVPTKKKGNTSQSGRANARTDAQGHFRLVGLTQGAYHLSVLCWNEHAETRFAPAEVDKVAAGTVDLVIRLRNVSRIEGFVREADGTPVPKATVIAHVGGPGTPPIGERGLSDGSFFVDVAEGDVADLEAYRPEDRNGDDSLRQRRSAHLVGIAAGTKGVELRLPPR